MVKRIIKFSLIGLGIFLLAWAIISNSFRVTQDKVRIKQLNSRNTLGFEVIEGNRESTNFFGLTDYKGIITKINKSLEVCGNSESQKERVTGLLGVANLCDREMGLKLSESLISLTNEGVKWDISYTDVNTDKINEGYIKYLMIIIPDTESKEEIIITLEISKNSIKNFNVY